MEENLNVFLKWETTSFQGSIAQALPANLTNKTTKNVLAKLIN
jgi:hypothetical protein